MKKVLVELNENQVRDLIKLHRFLQDWPDMTLKYNSGLLDNNKWWQDHESSWADLAAWHLDLDELVEDLQNAV